MRVFLKALLPLLGGILLTSIYAHGQISLPGFGQKNAGSNDQKANALLHQHLPLDLDANSAYPTVPNEDLLGGPFRGRVLPITLDTLTKPLPPGDYVLPMTFFCSEYSIHRPGAGTAYVLAPAKGTAAKAISTLLWRGMLTGHKPQELQSVSWAIQGSVAYDKMPASYKRLVDELIPDMKNQVNGQAFADIETGFQGKINKATKKVSDAIGKGTGGYVHADIKVDVELNQSFGRLGRLGKMALDGENINSIVTDATLTDDQRTHALYAGQGTQAPPLPAANGPWSVIVPGVAYMRFTVHGGNLQGDNLMQIRIMKPESSTAALDARPHLVLAQYSQSKPASPSLVSLVNGTVNQTALSQCLATNTPQNMCVSGSIDVGGFAAYSVATGTQSPLLAPANPMTPSSTKSRVCVKKVLYQPTDVYQTDRSIRAAVDPSVITESLGLCVYLAVVTDDGQSCSGLQTAEVPEGEQLNWVQTYRTTSPNAQCASGMTSTEAKQKAWRDPCDQKYGPLYRPDADPDLGHNNIIYKEGGADFDNWKNQLASLGSLQLVFRDIPQRIIHNKRDPKQELKQWSWFTTNDDHPKSDLDNKLRLVSYKAGQDAAYTPLIEVSYGVHFSTDRNEIVVDPLVIGGHVANGAGPESIDYLRADYNNLPAACTNTNSTILGRPPQIQSPVQ